MARFIFSLAVVYSLLSDIYETRIPKKGHFHNAIPQHFRALKGILTFSCLLSN
jgi:hypothetical protein